MQSDVHHYIRIFFWLGVAAAALPAMTAAEKLVKWISSFIAWTGRVFDWWMLRAFRKLISTKKAATTGGYTADLVAHQARLFVCLTTKGLRRLERKGKVRRQGDHWILRETELVVDTERLGKPIRGD